MFKSPYFNSASPKGFNAERVKDIRVPVCPVRKRCLNEMIEMLENMKEGW